MDRTTSLIRLELDGRWGVDEIGQCFSSLADLYDLRLYLESVRDDQRDFERFYEELLHFGPVSRRWKHRLARAGPLPWMAGYGLQTLIPIDDSHLSRLRGLFDSEERLEVRRITYASPGFADLAGLGTVVGHLKDFLLRLMERRDNRRQRELNDERAELENDRLRLENARQFVALARDLGYSDTDMRALTLHVDNKQGPILKMVEQRKLSGISTIEGEGDQS
jgi:hypothetical protein